jgi:hypothetical protein
MNRPSPLLLATLGACFAAAGGCATQASKSSAEETRARPQVTPAALREQVEGLLNGYERMPTDEEWKRIGPDALGVLEQIYLDATALPSRRTRAVASMAQVDNPAAADKLKEILQDGRVDVQYRSTAALALGSRMGSSAVPALEPALKDRDGRVREASARAMARLGSPEARRSLEEQLAKEEDPAVREVIQQSLTKTEP